MPSSDSIRTALLSLFAIAIIALASFGLVVANDAVGEMKKMNEPKAQEIVWPPSPWQVDPNWPDSYPIDYTIVWPNQYDIDWSESNPITITHYKPVWADSVAEKLTAEGGKIYFTDSENFVVNALLNPNVVAEEYMFIVTQYPSEHEMETMYIPYEKIERIRFSEAI